MGTLLDAILPHANATVSASAGTGKTWLLVSRAIRLLLEGFAPGGILAVTFTRKAAAEMESRLIGRLRDYTALDDAGLGEALAMIGVTANDELRQRARTLYERLLYADYPIRITTFHAFCQEILRSFPLEADVPPGFELLESTGLLEDEAWAALYEEATRHPDAPLAAALDHLFSSCNGLSNTHAALGGFLGHRSDWWAYTEGGSEPVATAVARLRALLQIDPEADPLPHLFDAPTLAALAEYTTLLVKHDTKTNLAQADKLATVRATDTPLEERHRLLCEVLLTAKGEPRAVKQSKAQAASMTVEGENRFLALNALLTRALLDCNDTLTRIDSYRLSSAWYLAGNRLLDHYQRLKREQRLLDFADLEWKCYQLLNNHEQSEWIQYKLDQRIEHLLIDEFQDTNPTQWQLIAPLLREMAAGGEPGRRSVFLVGDKKQSIYRFRRAEPRLMESAAEWLGEHLAATPFTMERSRRSAPAVIECVNRVFSETPLKGLIADFNTHQTFHDDQWGRVELLPLAEAESAEPVARQGLRNPLLEPRPEQTVERHLEEGRQIAAYIQHLTTEGVLIGDAQQARPLGYGDVLILLRNRTHIDAYEAALREAGIPYIGDQRGTLLESLEIRDMVTLLESLITPFSNLALAQILRSPLFAASDDELLQLAGSGSWMERLGGLAPELPPASPLARAHHWLSQWHGLVGQLPVHDLLDRIYSEGNVIARYEAAFPETLRPRVRANLTRFIELALEIDSGRYPSLAAFLARLRSLRSRANEAPDEAPAAGGEARVRLMTIHGSKGLEAPLVVLADTIGSGSNRNAYAPIVQWPAGAARPEYFLLAGRSDRLDAISRGLLEADGAAERREEANLLYVALTRARQLLLISATRPARGDGLGWYGLIRDALEGVAEPTDEGSLRLESGTPPSEAAGCPATQPPQPRHDPHLNQPVSWRPQLQEIAPSRRVTTPVAELDGDEDGRERGLLIHRLLELLSGDGETEGVLPRVAAEFDLDPAALELAGAYREATELLEVAAFADLFDASRYLAARNELPLCYLQEGHTVHGFIDRLVEHRDEVWVIDYKSHRRAAKQLDELSRHYQPQMACYLEGVRRLYPGKRVRGALLFTACRRLVEVDA